MQSHPGNAMRSDPEYIGIILAATSGSRLFPLTSEYPNGIPKHLIPSSPLSASGAAAGLATPLQRLLIKTFEAGFELVVLAIHKEDSKTIPYLIDGLCSSTVESMDGIVTDLEFNHITQKHKKQEQTKRHMQVRVVRLPEDCHGSADALRFLSSTKKHHEKSVDDSKNDVQQQRFIPLTSHAVIMSADLILEGDLLAKNSYDAKSNHGSGDVAVLPTLIQQHRLWNASSISSAVTMLLTDVGSEDKEGIPLKESSKAKLGRFARDEEDMEYIGLSSEVAPPLMGGLHASFQNHLTGGSRRVVLKRSKIEVEENDGTGNSTKLVVSKSRLHSGGINKKNVSNYSFIGGLYMATAPTASIDASPSLSIRTDLHDVHLYVISNWVFDLIHARPNMASFQKEVLPLLISRQFKGVEGAFGPTSWKVEENRERLKRILKGLDGEKTEVWNGSCSTHISSLLGMYASAKANGGLGGFLTDDPDDGDRPNPDELDATTPKSIRGSTSAASTLLCAPSFPSTVHPFAVSAHVLSREVSTLTLRACTIPTLLYGCGEITSRTLKLESTLSTQMVPKDTQLSPKSNSILLPNSTVGEKVQTKSCTIGSNVTLGDRAKLNNVLVMDGAVIGENAVLQNSVVGMGARVGENCNLKDCMVGSGAVVASGTKTTEKGEAFHV
ncbi:hypothetical protein ACHAW6_014570 [Cyclotella cf. meneghiniana]